VVGSYTLLANYQAAFPNEESAYEITGSVAIIKNNYDFTNGCVIQG